MAYTKKNSTRENLLANNHAVSVILQMNEEFYKQLYDEGTDVPKDKELIKFPVGIVETLDEYNSRYHLPDIIKRKITVSNAGACLQASDIYRFITERIGIYSMVRSMMYKDWFVCLMSVVEAMVDSSVRHLGMEMMDFQNRIVSKEYKRAVGLSNESAERLKQLYDLRNSIHLERKKIEKIKKVDFNHTNIDEAEEALTELAELLYKNAVPNYTK